MTDPLDDSEEFPAVPTSDGSDPRGLAARRLARGVCRLFGDLGYGTLTEFRINAARRVDVMAINGAGDIAIVEIKSSEADYRADRKWREYVPYCNAFYFAVPEDFPRELLPPECGLIVADGFEAAVVRTPPPGAVNGTRRRHLILRFALTASRRLARLSCPPP